MTKESPNIEQEEKKFKKERFRLLRRIDRTFEIPMIILAFVWIALLIIEVLKKNTPFLDKLSNVIWGLFVIDFIIKFILAPQKLKFIKSHIIILISLILPAFRVFNILRLAWIIKFTRGIVLLRLIGGMNRTMRALSMTMEKRAFGFIAVITLIILFSGAAGMLVFEKNHSEVLKNYSSAVWWTAMLMTTMGTDAWPVTAEGRILCLIIAIYSFTIFGYVTATFATFFLGEDSHSENPELASGDQVKELKKELKEIKELLLKNTRDSA